MSTPSGPNAILPIRGARFRCEAGRPGVSPSGRSSLFCYARALNCSNLIASRSRSGMSLPSDGKWMRFCSGVAQLTSISFGLATSTARQRARDTATLKRGHSLPIGKTRTRMRASSSTTTAPFSNEAAAARFAASSARCRLFCGAVEHCFVLSLLQAVIPDVYRVVSRLTKACRQLGRQGVVDEKLHLAASGSSRSLTASAAYCRASWISPGARSG